MTEGSRGRWGYREEEEGQEGGGRRERHTAILFSKSTDSILCKTAYCQEFSFVSLKVKAALNSVLLMFPLLLVSIALNRICTSEGVYVAKCFRKKSRGKKLRK
jgi:hypothetical protein